MRLGTLIRVPVLLATVALLAVPLRAQDQTKRKSPETSGAGSTDPSERERRFRPIRAILELPSGLAWPAMTRPSGDLSAKKSSDVFRGPRDPPPTG